MSVHILLWVPWAFDAWVCVRVYVEMFLFLALLGYFAVICLLLPLLWLVLPFTFLTQIYILRLYFSTYLLGLVNFLAYFPYCASLLINLLLYLYIWNFLQVFSSSEILISNCFLPTARSSAWLFFIFSTSIFTMFIFCF